MILVITGFCALALGQARNARTPGAGGTVEPKPVPPPYLVITKLDGSQVKGHLVASDPGSVTVRPPAPPGKPQNEPVAVKWAEIKTVSNGLTRQKVLGQWRVEHAGELCDTCKGEGMVVCATCKGTLHDPAKLDKNCPTCKGELLVDCKAPRCDKGKVPCPKPCLKLTDAGWFDRGGEKWRRFPEKGGFYEVSEHHVGQLVVTDKDGRKSTVPCPTCGGTAQIDCPVCHGTAKMPCPVCKKNDAAGACPDCGGKGLQACKTCAGTGMRAQPQQ